MTATELAALIVAIASVVAVVLLAFVLVSVTKTLKEVRAAVEVLRVETLPVMIELGDTVRSANAELERVDGVIGTARVDLRHGRLRVAPRLPRVLQPGHQGPGGGVGHRASGPVAAPVPEAVARAPSSVLAEPRHRGGVRGLVLDPARRAGDRRSLRTGARVGRPHRRREGLRHGHPRGGRRRSRRDAFSARPSCAPTPTAPAPEPRTGASPAGGPPVGSICHGRGLPSSNVERVLRRARAHAGAVGEPASPPTRPRPCSRTRG